MSVKLAFEVLSKIVSNHFIHLIRKLVLGFGKIFEIKKSINERSWPTLIMRLSTRISKLDEGTVTIQFVQTS